MDLRMVPVIQGVFLLLLLAAPAAAQSTVPVMMYPTDGQAAGCGGTNIVGLNPRGDGFLAVRAGPSTGSRKIDELYNGDFVNVCDQRGQWYGVVYGAGDCGVHDARPRRIAYRGSCRSGWVFGRYLGEIIP